MALPKFDDGLGQEEMDEMMENARNATSFLKALAHEGRLLILCHLASGEKSVTELEELLSARQAAVSQQLARLRFEGLVDFSPRGQNNFLPSWRRPGAPHDRDGLRHLLRVRRSRALTPQASGHVQLPNPPAHGTFVHGEAHAEG